MANNLQRVFGHSQRFFLCPHWQKVYRVTCKQTNLQIVCIGLCTNSATSKELIYYTLEDNAHYASLLLAPIKGYSPWPRTKGKKLKLKKKSRIRETPTLSIYADSRTDTILERLRDLPIRTEKRTWSTRKCGLGPR